MCTIVRPLPYLTFSFCVLLWLPGCTPRQPEAPRPHEDLDATLWMQRSAEYPALTRQLFRIATEKLELARHDPTWSAEIAQQEQLRSQPSGSEPLPSAVILDLDETVFDNSDYQSLLIENDDEFRREDWNNWVKLCRSRVVAGAAEFIRFCRAAGVTVFFVSNRENEVEPATLKNLEQLGLIDKNSPDTLLCRDERDEWRSDKTSRRQFVASRYRVLLILGDDLNDFVWAGDAPSPETRQKLSEEHDQMWGERWILFPNANYGGWERALYEFNDALPRAGKIERKRAALRSSEPAHAPATAAAAF